MSKNRKPPPPPPEPFHNPFGGLAERLALAPARALPADERSAPKKVPARAVVRLERKGRRGKEATVIEKLDLPGEELALWLRELKQALGCGGALEEGALALQGDLRERVKPLLEARGVRKVTLG